ncbi:MAG: YicC family protein [Treponema sp.]|nr:YicC family protein [Treponema sp.]
MTAYAYRELQEAGCSLSVEIRSYNSRFLEIYVNTAPRLLVLEPGIREQVARRCARGKVELSLRLRDLDAPVKVLLNREAAAAYDKAIRNLAETLRSAEKPSLSMILACEGVLEAEKERDADRYWGRIEPVLKAALDDFDLERAREGKHTEEDILSHLGILESSLKTVASFAPRADETIKTNLRARFAEVLGDRIDENRILAETAVLLMKYTISEEVSRLSAHFAEFRAETGRNQSPGKKLDFLCQEINREINTIGSKSPVLEISRAVVDMKNALENIREQLRNVE